MTTPHRYVSGAIDLSEVKARAEARAQASSQPAGGGGVLAALQLTMDNVEAELIKRSAQVPVIVLIGTPRSPDSEQLKADLAGLAESSNKAFVFRYIDADTTPEVAQMFGIQALPTTVALASGQPLATFEGGQPLDALQQWTNAVVKAVAGQLPGLGEENAEDEPAEDPRFEPATDALNRGDFDAAIAVYDSILASEPKNQMALQARDNARLLGRLKTMGTDPASAVAAAQADPLNLEVVEAAADAHIALGQPEQAFDALIHVIANAADAKEKTAARERLLELFALFEAADARVIAARSKLASALY